MTTRKECLFKFFLQKNQDSEVSHIKTSKWENHISKYLNESKNLSFEQFCTVRLQVIDSLLKDAQLPKTFTNRLNCNRRIFAPFEPADLIRNFEKWMRLRIEDDFLVIKEVNKYLVQKIQELKLDIEMASNNNHITFGLEELEAESRSLFNLCSENITWRND